MHLISDQNEYYKGQREQYRPAMILRAFALLPLLWRCSDELGAELRNEFLQGGLALRLAEVPDHVLRDHGEDRAPRKHVLLRLQVSASSSLALARRRARAPRGGPAQRARARPRPRRGLPS